MGVKNLIKWIKRYSPSAIEMINFNDMKNKRLGIDASILIYRSELAIKGSGFEMRNKYGAITSHLYVIFFKTIKMLQNNILPIYVFDGRYNKLKHNAMTQRKKKIDKIKKEIEINKNFTKEQINKKELQTFEINDQMYNDLIKMLSLMGIAYIEAEGEADSLLAYMNIKGYIDGVISEDTDICIFGADNLYKNVFTNMNHSTKDLIEHIQYKNILKEVKWSRVDFVDLAILLGCDYAPHIKGIGMVAATNLINTNKDLYTITKKLKIDKDDTKILLEAQKFIMTDGLHQSKEIINKLDNMKLGPLHRNKLYDFMVNENQINKQRIIKGLENISHAIKVFKVMNI